MHITERVGGSSMTDSKTFPGAPKGFLARLEKARGRTPGEGRSARLGYSSVVSFRRPMGGAKSSRERDTAEDGGSTGPVGNSLGATGLFVAHASGLAPRDPVAHPRFRPRLAGAAQKIYQLCEEASPAPVQVREQPVSKTMEVDIAAFVEAVSAAYPQPRDPDVRPVLKARPNQAARPFVYLPGAPDEIVAGTGLDEAQDPVRDAEMIQRAHRERELKAFHEFLDRMESGPLEALDHSLADLDDKAEARRRFAAPLALYDPILEGAAVACEGAIASHDAPPVPEEDRHLIQAVIEPLDPVAKPRLPSPAEVLAGAMPQRLSPSQRAHLKRPVTLRDRHGRIAPVTYSLNPRSEV